jgi:phage baseplate assembly protein W
MQTGLGFSYRFDARGRTTLPGGADHVRDLIEQVLFTTPGERVMRPDFGSGLGTLVFAPASVDLAAATELMVRSALQTWLGDVIEVSEATVEIGDGSIEIRVDYTIRETGEDRSDLFQAGGAL